MLDVLLDTLLDTAKAMPFLFAVYLLLELIQKKVGSRSFEPRMFDRFGPLIGAAVGCVPQCGFSAAASELYVKQKIRCGTLIAVFLATSDEAVPVLLASYEDAVSVLPMLAVKLAAGIIFGYLLNMTVFKNEMLTAGASLEIEFNSCESEEHHHHDNSVLKSALYHTVKIAAYLLATMLVINLAIYAVGEQTLSRLLLTGNALQPLAAAAVGLVPGCAISVLITRLFIEGQLTFGSAVAGLCTGAGFGYVVLARGLRFKKLLKVLACTYICAAAAGMLLDSLL